ncbi:MATE family efflux transporter [Bartonella doshiae]|uniref:Na(+)/drug antiporter n=2 Tax=Bartonella doshiae TaxID=33044 RepID=A0A380ZEJ9_BARDO|nr:MATE family efflux transporter [Bartonella doshiae]EJF79634.1 MATE efflux family protein [Bartonella doshiae NCTC 12862 = ATCC 700133]MBB6160083.1 MATE family multidrug resistance protein [Bartonella doshiae]SUV45397.1 Na(+)/drug antiporter [Bartonella doshiae]
MFVVMKQLLLLGMPLAIGFISQMMISFTDAALVAHLGVQALSGTMLALSMFSFVMLLGLGIITAVAPKLAESFRKQDRDALKAWFDQGIWLSLLIGIISAIILLNTRNILCLLGQNEAIANIAQKYNSGAAIGVVFFYLYVNSRGLLSAIGHPKHLTWIMLAAIPVNFLISWLLIFGIGPASGFGVFGAGIASSLIRILIVMAVAIILSRNSTFSSFHFNYLRPKLEISRIIQLLFIGLPIGIRILIAEGFPSVIAFMITAFGVEALAAHTIGMRLDMLISVVALGISSAAATIAAWYQADRNHMALKQLRMNVTIFAIAYVLFLSGGVYFSYEFILSIIFDISSVHVIVFSWELLPFILLSFAFGTLGAMLNGILVGLLDTFWPTIVVTISYWGIGLFGGALMAHFFEYGFMGYWLGMIGASLIVSLFNYMRVGYLIKRNSILVVW